MNNSFKPTKLDKVKQIVCASRNLQQLPDENHKVVKRMMRLSLSDIDPQYKLANKILLQRGEVKKQDS